MNDSLETLLADGIIEAVLGQLKTGKEAEVWLVQHAGQVVAAKLYKERHERNFRNNVGYREGREVRNSRTRRAMEKGSKFGQAAAEEAWKSAESDSLYKLHAQGVRVPTPVLFYEGILLMEVVIDAQGHPAPRLVEAPPTTPEEALAMYVDLRAQVISMLCADLIHGDLSPYNILMGYAGPVIIDFPQTIAAARNNRAEFYFRRDLDNVREFLATYAPALYGMAGDTGEIWSAYVRRELTPDFVPSGGFREGARRGGKGRPDARFGGGNPRMEQRAPQVEVAAAPPKPAMTPEEAAEAELLELEALVLRQGGGERGKPPAAPAQRGGRRGPGRGPPRPGNNRPNPPASQQARPAGGGGARPPQANGARPAQGEQRNGGPRGLQGGAHNGNGEAPRNGDARNGGHRPQGGAGDSRGGPRGFQGDRRNGETAQGAGDSRGGPRGFQGERRNGTQGTGDSRGGPRGFEGNAAQGAGDSRGGPRGFQGERRNGDTAQSAGDSRGGPRGFQGERRNGAQGAGDSRGGPRGFEGNAAQGAGDSRGGPREFQGERRNGDAAQGAGDSRGGPRGFQGDARGAGDSRGRGPRGPQDERRNGGPRSFQGEARNGQDAATGVQGEGARGPGDFRNTGRRGDPSEPRNGHAGSRPPMNGHGNRDERQPVVEHRGQGNELQAGASITFTGNDSRPPRGERRGGPNRPPQPAVETRPSSGPGGNTLREARQPRPNSNRGNAPRGPRGGPQVSYVARNNNPSDSGPTETGS